MTPPSGDLIGIDFENEEFIQTVLPRLPQKIRDQATDDVAEYLLNVMRAYPPYRKVTRTSVYGQPFQSDRQRRWFFASLDSGELQVPYQRTQGVSRGWEIIGSGESKILVNEAPGAQYAYGGNRLLAAIGWKRLAVMVSERQAKIKTIIAAAVKKALRKR
jgi:hypothetical protein